jgi:hypothetical protein
MEMAEAARPGCSIGICVVSGLPAARYQVGEGGVMQRNSMPWPDAEIVMFAGPGTKFGTRWATRSAALEGRLDPRPYVPDTERARTPVVRDGVAT